RLMSRGGEPQREGHSDIVPELVGGLPVALADAEVEPPERRLAAHVPHGDAVLGGVAEREGHAHVTRHASERELADGLVAGRRLRELRGRVVRLRELRHREQVRAAQVSSRSWSPVSAELISTVTSSRLAGRLSGEKSKLTAKRVNLPLFWAPA